MEIAEFYSDESFHFSTMLINPDVVNAFKLRTRIFLDPNEYSKDAIHQAEQDFHLDLSKMIELHHASKTHEAHHPEIEQTVNKFLELCLGFRIQQLTRVRDAMPSIDDEENDLQLNALLQENLMRVNSI